MTKYVVDAGVVLHLLSENLELPAEHEFLAPTLIRSQVLEALFNAVRAGEIPRDVARRRLDRFATMKMRFLGDRVLRDVAWKVAEQLGWDSTHTAEYIALTQLQADAFITLDEGLARGLKETVETASVEVLL